jgi:peptide/nickel transport system permease protein
MAGTRGAARRETGVRIGATLLGFAVLVALFGPGLVAVDPLVQDLAARNQWPSALHPLGTDSLGRDILARLVEGARVTLGVAMAATLVAVILGAGGALLALALGRIAEETVFGIVDLIRAMPSILLALTLMIALGIGTTALVAALGLAYAPFFARIARAAYLRESGMGYVDAAWTMGVGRTAILRRHILPNVAGALITQAAIVFPRAITSESVLSFFGLGAEPSMPTWGRMIADAIPFVERAPLALAFPVGALTLTTLATILLGDRLRRAVDPLAEMRLS